jgi:endopolyphosphatase
MGADFEDNDNRTAGYFAVPDGPCDSPWTLINATFEYIEKVWKDKIDFIVWTGDNVRYVIVCYIANRQA